MNDKRDDRGRPERLKAVSDEIVDISSRIQAKMTKGAQEHGYVCDLFRLTGPEMGKMPDDPLLEPIESSLISFRNILNNEDQMMGALPGKVDGTAFTLVSSIGVSGCVIQSTVAKMPEGAEVKYVYSVPANAPFWPPDREETYATRLERIDPELGRIYRSVMEAFFGTTGSPERSAMYLMRQAFDHLFGLLAPDGEVRQTIYFKKKNKPEDENLVYREERIQYAANKHITDPLLAATLVADGSLFVSNYRRLNKAHERAPIDRETARAVLTSVRGFMESWVDALNR